jgi:hypothetical protein
MRTPLNYPDPSKDESLPEDVWTLGERELELTESHVHFPLEADSFGFRYFDDEEEQSKEYLKEYKQIGRWFSQMALEERPKVLKQWREMAVEADFEWLHDNFSSKLFKDEDGK